MIVFLAMAQTAALAVLIALIHRRVPSTAPPWNRALAAMGGGAALFGILTLAWLLLLDGRSVSLAAGRGLGLPGLLWLTQALRLLAALVAVAGWWSVSREYFLSHRRLLFLVLAMALIGGLNGRGLGTLAWFVTLIALRRHIWMAEIRGWRRIAGLLVAPLLALGLVAVPITTIGPSGPLTTITLGGNPWPPALLTAGGPPALLAELAVTRPLDRFLYVLLLPLSAQLVILTLQFLALPVSLRGTSLKRRIAVNYFFIRVVPGFLGAILTGLVIYLGYGLHKAAMVREAFDETLARARPAVNRLAADPAVTGGDPALALARLDEAQEWITNPGESPRFLLRAPDGTVLALSGELPGAALRLAPFLPDSLPAAAGLLERGGGLFLVVRQVSIDAGGRRLEVWVPLDSLYLAQVASRVNVDIHLQALPELFVNETNVRAGADSAWTTQAVRVGAHYRPPRPESDRMARPFYLCRTFLPVGDWRAGRHRDMAGAVQLTLQTSLRYLALKGRESVFLFSTNAMTFGLIFVALLLIGLTESIAVRTGRGILASVLKEVTTLRDAAQRFGRGDLDHRIPVEGKDEIGTVARALNEMAANLKRQQGELVEKERLEADLAVAREIQQRLLPQAPPLLPGFDVAGISIPSREVGGDLFYFFTGPRGQLGLALGDVSGKSVPAALLMSSTLAALRAQVELEPSLAAGMARMNRILHDQIEPGRFVTLAWAEFEPPVPGAPPGLSFEYASAGHNPILKVTADGAAEWLADGGLPLGMMADAVYDSHRGLLAAGDLLILYSDGVTEAARLKAGADRSALAGEAGYEQLEFFDEERLAEVAAANRHRPAARILESILAAVRDFCRGYPQSDDITLVVVRRLATPDQAAGPPPSSSS